jgi:hypothetical protein
MTRTLAALRQLAGVAGVAAPVPTATPTVTPATSSSSRPPWLATAAKATSMGQTTAVAEPTTTGSTCPGSAPVEVMRGGALVSSSAGSPVSRPACPVMTLAPVTVTLGSATTAAAAPT